MAENDRGAHPCDWWDDYGRQLWDMNCDGVNVRYGYTGENGATHEVFAWHCTFPKTGLKDDIRAWRIEHVKSLQCLIYQCSEGDIDQRPLYKALRKKEHETLAEIVRSLPEYDAAEWD
jgi:hypothetical protein